MHQTQTHGGFPLGQNGDGFPAPLSLSSGQKVHAEWFWAWQLTLAVAFLLEHSSV